MQFQQKKLKKKRCTKKHSLENKSREIMMQFIIVTNFCDFNEKSRWNYGAQETQL